MLTELVVLLKFPYNHDDLLQAIDQGNDLSSLGEVLLYALCPMGCAEQVD